MRFIIAALIASTSAFSITIDKNQIGKMAHNWGSTVEDFVKWGEEKDREVIKAARPYLEEMDKQLKALADISEKANEETAEQAMKSAREGMSKMMADLECSQPEEYEVQYQRCEYHCDTSDGEKCERKCKENSYKIRPRCDDLGWFLNKM